MKTNPNDFLNQEYEVVRLENRDATSERGGLTKREYFAALAMQGLLSNSFIFDGGYTGKISEMAIESADHLIQELNK